MKREENKHTGITRNMKPLGNHLVISTVFSISLFFNKITVSILISILKLNIITYISRLEEFANT